MIYEILLEIDGQNIKLLIEAENSGQASEKLKAILSAEFSDIKIKIIRRIKNNPKIAR